MPVSKKGRNITKKILDVCARLFTEQGYAATSTRQIAKELGITQGNLYFHFQTKEDILSALVDKIVEKKIKLANKIGENIKDPYIRHALSVVLHLNVITKDKNITDVYLSIISSPKIRAFLIDRYIKRIEISSVYNPGLTHEGYWLRISSIYGSAYNLIEAHQNDRSLSKSKILEILVIQSLTLLTNLSINEINERMLEVENILKEQDSLIDSQLTPTEKE